MPLLTVADDGVANIRITGQTSQPLGVKFLCKLFTNLSSNIKQLAQLSQRDWAAAYISYGQKLKTGTGRQCLRT